MADPDFGEGAGSGIPIGATQGYGASLDILNPIDSVMEVFDGRGVDERKKLNYRI